MRDLYGLAAVVVLAVVAVYLTQRFANDDGWGPPPARVREPRNPAPVSGDGTMEKDDDCGCK